MAKLLSGLLVVLLLSSVHADVAEIEVRGLFGGAALLSINGREQLLKKGQQSPEGVRLLDADASSALLSIDGEERRLYLSDKIGASFTPASRSQVHIRMNDNRQYLTAGSINGRSVSFLVDTGANVIALNSNIARSLGISTHDGQPTRVTTASATQTATRVTLKEVQVGAIRLQNVAAVVINGSHPTDILLGMSFLQHVNISENNGLMVLTAHF